MENQQEITLEQLAASVQEVRAFVDNRDKYLSERLEDLDTSLWSIEQRRRRIFDMKQNFIVASKQIAAGAILAGMMFCAGRLSKVEPPENTVKAVDGTEYQLVPEAGTKPGCYLFEVKPSRPDAPVMEAKFPYRCKP
jgi:hypothetical protein